MSELILLQYRRFSAVSNNNNNINIVNIIIIIITIVILECNKIRNDTIPFISDHIINGEVAAMGEFPHMVSVFLLLNVHYFILF